MFNHQLLNTVSELLQNKQFDTDLDMFIYACCNGLLTYEDYTNNKITNNFKNIEIYKKSPRIFGETWLYSHTQTALPYLEKPTKIRVNNYSGEYDYTYKSKRIEIKSSRLVDFNSKLPLSDKSLELQTDKKFNMNFQQIKPDCFDVAIFVVVTRSEFHYYVISANEIRNNKYYCDKQHRGNIGEGQLHITNKNINEFVKYKVDVGEIQKRLDIYV
jgi:hypothetical protein